MSINSIVDVDACLRPPWLKWSTRSMNWKQLKYEHMRFCIWLNDDRQLVRRKRRHCKKLNKREISRINSEAPFHVNQSAIWELASSYTFRSFAHWITFSKQNNQTVILNEVTDKYLAMLFFPIFWKGSTFFRRFPMDRSYNGIRCVIQLEDD